MFDLERLEDIKWQVEKHMQNPNALIESTVLSDGKYEIIKLEEITDRALVYKALEVASGNCVSVKEFFPKDALGLQEQLYFERDFETNAIKLKDSTVFKEKQFKTLIDGFIEEARYLEKISYGDPILRIVDSFRDLGTAYIVTNYNEWPSLQDFLDVNYIFNETELEWIISSLLDMVVRFHKRSIVHRNVNTRNIYFTPGELIIDSLGTCDFLQDIKIYDADAYHNKYYAPEVMMHNGIIGTWTDVYAIGKVMIDIITQMTDKKDYFEGLKSIDDIANREAYAKAVKASIAFNYEDRIQDAMTVRKTVYPDNERESVYKTPKSMVAVIAMITVLSSVVVLWQNSNQPLIANLNIPEEEVPRSEINIVGEKEDLYFIDATIAAFEKGETDEIMWFRSGRCTLNTVMVMTSDGDIIYYDVLEENQNTFNLYELDLKAGSYVFELDYTVDDQDYTTKTTFEIKE